MPGSGNKQAIACGHPEVFQVAKWVLQEGGNAADAAVAAALCSCVAEPVLASLGGGGLGIVSMPDGRVEALDFWIAPPQAYDPDTELDIALLDWPGGTKQPFAVGSSSVGVWGMPKGLELLSTQYGTMSLAQVSEPAISLADSPPMLNQSQAEWLSLLHGVHTRFGALKGVAPIQGEAFAWPGLADSLSMFARYGATAFYTGEWSKKALRTMGMHGPSAEDLMDYEVIAGPARQLQLGELILRLPIHSLTADMLEALTLPGSHDRKSLDSSIVDNLREFASSDTAHSGPSTTSIMIRDSEGMSVALVLSNGSGSGIIHQGVQLNNVGGEIDLLNAAAWKPGSSRFPTRMCPLTAEMSEHWLMLGSGGSERITAATIQVLYYALLANMELYQAVSAPRIYIEEQTAHIEPLSPFSMLIPKQMNVNEWETLHQYFGGVNAISSSKEKTEAVSDPRRQGESEVF